MMQKQEKLEKLLLHNFSPFRDGSLTNHPVLFSGKKPKEKTNVLLYIAKIKSIYLKHYKYIIKA